MKKIRERFLPGKEFLDLEGWRSYYVGAMLFLSLFIFPLGIASSLPTLIAEGKIWLLFVEAVVVFTLIVSFLRFRQENPPTKLYFLLLFGLTVLYLITLGPLYARPGWLLLCAVSASLLFGMRAALGTIIVNAALLILLYMFAGPHLATWAPVYQDPFTTWLMFTINISLLSLFASLPGGMLLNQMNRLLIHERGLREQLASESESLQSINAQLLNEISERRKAEQEQKRLQTELDQAQKMEAMGTLAGGIAHDFNNILSAIIGYSQLALTAPELSDKTRQKITEVLTAGDRARALVNQILTFSRKSEIQRVHLRLAESVADALNMMRSLIPANITVEKDCTVPGLILSNGTYIHQIIINLFNNAIHAMGRDGGTLVVGISREYIDETTVPPDPACEPGSYLKMTVSDTGCGMNQETAGRVFEPYFTTKEAGHGTGLGLAVVHGIMKSHGGAITCQSSPGEGASFDLYFPEIEDRRKPEQARQEDTIPAGTENILYVDDEPTIVDVAREILEWLGYHVTTQTDSIRALNLFTENPQRFDLVVTDMAMPNLTGDKLTRQMLALRPDIPIIMCTGYSEHISREDAARLGIREFLMKPYDLSQLAHAVRRAIDDRQPDKESSPVV